MGGGIRDARPIVDPNLVQQYHLFMMHEHFKSLNKAERELVTRILTILKDRLPQDIVTVEVRYEPRPILRIRFKDGLAIDAHCYIRSQLRPSTLPLLESACREKRHAIIFTNFVSRPIAERLRKGKIWFADACGNVYIEVPQRLMFFTIGATPHKHYLERTNILTENGAKLMFYLLTHGPEIEATYRNIADDSGLSLGSVSILMKALARQRIVEGARRNYRIVDGERLLDLWTQAYLEKLKPKRFLGRFISLYRKDLSKLKEAVQKMKLSVGLSGELAAEVLTGYLKAQSVDLWVDLEEFEEVKTKLRLMKSQNGNIRVYTHFNLKALSWSPMDKIMPVPVVISDFIEIDDPRCLETVEELQKRYLQWTLG
ncbi:MAG: hypothetical protein DRQ10_07855 [Candidatus Hydrothermota bacterium]|nr:MAG: hypothetical protein DRQ10_07855 [Candidatus Hydrothermae bacterium]